MSKRKKKKVCVAIFSRANYGSIRNVLNELKKSKKIKLQILTGGSASVEKYGLVSNLIRKDNFKVDKEIFFLVDGDKPISMVITTALGMIKTGTVFEKIKPDLVLTVGDRYETLATAVSAAYMNIPIAHTMGGEITGTIDESTRHAITKFSHIHFPANENAKKNIVKMGENKESVYVVGCPRIDLVKQCLKNKIPDINNRVFKNGSGKKFDLNKDFITIMQHPVTTEFGQGAQQITATLKAVSKINMPKLFFWPNADAGSEEISKIIRTWRRKNLIKNTWFIKNLEHELFFHVLNMTKCLIGNTSAAIREGSFIGVPSVSIGTRQNGRERGKNVVDCDYNWKEIYSKTIKQIKLNRKNLKSKIYGDGKSSKRIRKIIENVKINVQKKLMF